MKSSTTLKRFGSEAKLNLISAAAAEESAGVSDTTSNPLESVAKRSGSSSRCVRNSLSTVSTVSMMSIVSITL